MRIGVMSGALGDGATLDDLVQSARDVEAAGLDTLWMANIFGFDAVGALAVVAREVPRLRFGTAVTPTFPRHPTALAQQALTTAAASGNRFTLGIGLSHRLVIENMLGLSYERPVRHMREYLEVLMPLLHGKPSDHDGSEYRTAGVQLRVGGADPVPVVVAALGPMMLRVAGELADGTSTWMVGPNTMREHIVARIGRAARDAGRAAPKIVGGVPVVLTNNADLSREKAGEALAVYSRLPSYRAMLDREGVEAPTDVALIGDEATLRSGIERFEEAGVTDLNAAVLDLEPGAMQRTLEFLAKLV